MVYQYLTLLLLFLAGCNGSADLRYKAVPSAAAATYKVISVKDGDTFVLLMNNREQVVRLAHIDCPEKKQPFGNQAQQFVSDRCWGKRVSLVHHYQYDRNRRLIAEVILEDGCNLNKELVQNGLAWHFKRYSNDEEYAALEAIARQQRKGLWADEHPGAPWNWRRR
ncbi:thermonuclease family protein [Niabella drilacis]|uniref:Endonuclease YncB, thermonuclease family n=1 Tax=Niabella drilacis (strain DSM 25811 / CCM 8410 / CCUG 62505 / LMG 26954 / E90) TaxID=1285928 RepID=A0A1G6PIF8_NIADE|nr:thermonuclease family protein [Niabella drilacis]SDC79943.1 Endonuclease YncB, thermonuclease family [Niabella drilacis]